MSAPRIEAFRVKDGKTSVVPYTHGRVVSDVYPDDDVSEKSSAYTSGDDDYADVRAAAASARAVLDRCHDALRCVMTAIGDTTRCVDDEDMRAHFSEIGRLARELSAHATHMHQ